MVRVTFQQEVGGQTRAVDRSLGFVPRIGESVEVFDDETMLMSGIVKNVIVRSHGDEHHEVFVVLRDRGPI